MSWFGRRSGGDASTTTSKARVGRSVEEAGKAESTSAPDELLDTTLDALGMVLRTFGRNAFSLEETTAAQLTARYERWARHVLNGAPAPDSAEASQKRDYRALQRDFSQRRKAEAEHVRRVRELVWDVMNAIRSALAHNSEADRRLREPLDRLRKVVSSEATMAQMRSEVDSAIAVMEQAIADRKDAQSTELRGVGQKLKSAKAELMSSQTDGEIDPLTQVFSKRAFDQHVENAASLADLTGEHLVALLVNADGFKALNDVAGRDGGDRILKAIADATVRVASRSTDYVARVGGDEFVVVLGDTDIADATKVADRIRESAERISLPGRAASRSLTLSIAIAEHGPFEDCKSWLARASSTLKQAKSQGGNRVVVAQDP